LSSAKENSTHFGAGFGRQQTKSRCRTAGPRLSEPPQRAKILPLHSECCGSESRGLDVVHALGRPDAFRNAPQSYCEPRRFRQKANCLRTSAVPGLPLRVLFAIAFRKSKTATTSRPKCSSIACRSPKGI